MAARTWVIDAANVVGARPDGWWRDRPGAAARLHARVLRLLAAADWPADLAGQDEAPARVVLVLEGAARAGVEPGTVSPRARPPDAHPDEAHPDGNGSPDEETDGPRAAGVTLAVVHAPGAGDDAIVAEAGDAEPPVLAFTSDRALRERLVEAGARVRGAGSLWALLDET
ncbi:MULTISPECIES: hypothetical protein [unclassified Pseudofrankia]|uniref:hypothetical protein n=1 Tax=unclassified Pseudofrankia TaxID=2994372 RepID=UPI0008DAF0AA|nr:MULTISPECIES: hypothetical protein [unclassified Pseudofrankia]MDT3443063.1 hypothetical protein [Pseudofrankia sp. BMG5.37]OHV49936.1 hypothetical protein BCD48_11225 [Pseudofrankia sp. BMG5.36]